MKGSRLVPLNLRRLRVARVLSQERLANEANLERRYVGAIERGEENPTIATLDRLADALGVHVSEFFVERGLGPRLIPGLRAGRKPVSRL
jgi:transcriptional regulator with XRE-family HTH domain